MHPAPEVTVIIPTRNRRRFLERAVADALRQQDVDLEVVVVDDGSSDPDAVGGLDGLDPRLRLVRHDRKRGVAAARNTGIREARGRWLAFLDDDDRWAPHKLRVQLRIAGEHDAAWVYAGALTIDADSRILFATKPEEATDMKERANPVPGGCSNVIARADLVRRVGGFDEELALIADWDLWIRLADSAPPALCDELLVAYRRHPENMHVRSADALDHEFEHVSLKHQISAWRQPDLIIWQAYAYRRAGNRRRAARLYFRGWMRTRRTRDLARAVGSLAGERAAELLRARIAQVQLPRPAWLDENAPRPAEAV